MRFSSINLVNYKPVVRQYLTDRKLGLLLWRRSPLNQALLSNDDFSTYPARGRTRNAAEHHHLIYAVALTTLTLAAWLFASIAATAQQGERRRQWIERFKERAAQSGPPSMRIPMTWIDAARLSSGAPLPAGDYARRLTCGDQPRWYEIHVPPTYKPGTPMPVVLLFHGGGGNPDQNRFEACIDDSANRHGFIAIIPAGTGQLADDKLLTWNCRICCGSAQKNNIDDVGFVRSLLADAGNLFSIDQNRIFATGLSNGALMSYMLASFMPDRIAAIAPIAAILPPQSDSAAKPVPIMHFHGLLDDRAPYKGGVGVHSIANTEFPGVRTTMSKWLTYNRCPQKPTTTKKQGHALIETYKPAAGGAEIVLCTLEDGGHTWPGGRLVPASVKLNLGKINTDISANDAMWEFFQRHPLPSTPAKEK